VKVTIVRTRIFDKTHQRNNEHYETDCWQVQLGGEDVPLSKSEKHPGNAACFGLTRDEFVPIPAGGQPKRSHPISVPGDEITPRIRRCHVPNKDILIMHLACFLQKRGAKVLPVQTRKFLDAAIQLNAGM